MFVSLVLIVGFACCCVWWLCVNSVVYFNSLFKLKLGVGVV